MLLLALALAEEPPVLDVQLVRPSADAQQTLWVEDGAVPTGTWVRYNESWARSTLSVVDGHGELTPVAEHMVVGELLLSHSWRSVRGTMGLPTSHGSVVLGESGVGLGDLHGELELALLRRPQLGVSVIGRATAPTGGAPLMAAGGFTYTGLVAAHADLGPVRVAVNAGSQGVPPVQLGELTWDDRALYRAGVSLPLGPGGVALEYGGSLLYTALDQPGGAPSEALLSGWYRIGPTRFVLRAGVGVGLVGGIGSSRGRALVGLGYEPTGLEDRDRDGLADRDDRCPRMPEDADGVEDDDGCAEPTELTLLVTDAAGDALPFVATLGGQLLDGEGRVAIDAGPHELVVESEGYDPLRVELQVPDGPPIQHRVSLGASIGTLRVTVVDPAGEPLDAALVVVDVTTGLADLGTGDMQVPAGDHVLVVETEQYFPARVEFTMDPGGLRHLEIQLEPVIARMSADRIQVDQTVLFETGSAEILEASDDLLGQVADLMLIYPDIRVRVEGHTDDVGDDASNLELSQARAEAVRDYLVMMHVPPERLVAVGYGETQPLVEGTSPEARAANRRVEFVFIDDEVEP